MAYCFLTIEKRTNVEEISVGTQPNEQWQARSPERHGKRRIGLGRHRLGGYRVWDMLGGLAQLRSPTLTAATGI